MLIDHFPFSRDRFWDSPVKVALALALVSLLAPIGWTPPGSTLAITLQTLVLLVQAQLLGSWRGALVALLYLVAGALGLPVFAEGATGWAHLWGETGGFLWGFVGGAWLAGRLARGERHRLLRLLSGQALGHAFILLAGFGWPGWTGDTVATLARIWPGLLVKVLLGAGLVWLGEAVMRAITRRWGQEAP
ncbi:MAG: biotin transporter BioY [Bacteroidetes bacterium]|nr:MAG: biotin transporter BioY [Bacteroidota bacterium]